MNDIRLIAMDLDGTLLQRDQTILPQTLQALRAAEAKGVTLALASGRYPENASLVFLDHGIDGPVMGANGAIIDDAPMGTTLAVHFMPGASAAAICGILDRAGADYILFSYKRVTTSRTDLQHRSEINDGERIHRLGGVTFAHGPAGIREALRQGVSKIFVFNHPRLAELADEIRSVPGVQVTRSGELNIEIMPRGIHKGNGIRELARHLGIPLSAVMAFGDEENDLEMLRSVGYGFAMGNAPEHVRRQCRRATDSFERDGIGKAIRRYILEEGE